MLCHLYLFTLLALGLREGNSRETRLNGSVVQPEQKAAVVQL
jgi:hypothetical protein